MKNNINTTNDDDDKFDWVKSMEDWKLQHPEEMSRVETEQNNFTISHQYFQEQNIVLHKAVKSSWAPCWFQITILILILIGTMTNIMMILK